MAKDIVEEYEDYVEHITKLGFRPISFTSFKEIRLYLQGK